MALNYSFLNLNNNALNLYVPFNKTFPIFLIFHDSREAEKKYWQPYVVRKKTNSGLSDASLCCYAWIVYLHRYNANITESHH